MGNNPKRVASPTQTSRAGGIKQAKTSIVEGPTAKGGHDNLNPYNRKKK